MVPISTNHATIWYRVVPQSRGLMAKRTKPPERPDEGEIADERRRRIQEAAFEVVKERGYAQATTLEIATRAKVSKRELYALFDDKQAIIAACIAGRVRQMQVPLELSAVRDRDGLAQLLTGFGSTVLRVVSDPEDHDAVPCCCRRSGARAGYCRRTGFDRAGGQSNRAGDGSVARAASRSRAGR